MCARSRLVKGNKPAVLIVGAGPAGTRAAETLVAHGVAPVLVDEGVRSGGQIYRQPPAGFARPASALYGFEARKAQAVHAALAAVRDRLDYRPGTLIWNIERGVAQTLGPEGVGRIEFGSLILATGAMDRVIPFPGWTLPGVFTMGGAQVALKAQGCAIGNRVVFMGTGPLLYLVAYQYAHAGARVAAVLDTSRAGDAIPVLPGLLWGGRTFAKGLWYMTWLRTAGIPVRRGIVPMAAEGEAALEAVRYRDRRGREHRIACTGLGIGYGVKSEVQLAELAGCEMAFDPLAQQWLPQADEDGRALAGAVYLAGDGAGVAGADAAELRGRLAAYALLADRGIAIDGAQQARLRARLRRVMRFRNALERALPVPHHLTHSLPDETVVCRCEVITAGEIRQGRALAPAEMNRAKAFTRVGMGRCQGRVCGPAAAQILAAARGCDVAEVGRLRGQAPVKPLAIRAGAQAAVEDRARAASI